MNMLDMGINVWHSGISHAAFMYNMPAFPTPSAIIAGSRLQLPNIALYSNGTNTGSNSRIATYNETGATITKLKAFWVNWNSVSSSSNEANGNATLTITASIEYPAGTFNQCTFSASTSATIGTSANALPCDEVTLSTPIPPGSIFWIRTYVTVTSGGKWPIVYNSLNTAANMSEGCTLGTGTSDATMSGTISGSNAAYGPSAILATAWTGTSVKFGVIGLGDSVIVGATDAAETQDIGHGNLGFIGKACSGKVPYYCFAVTGSSATFQTGANFTKRLDLLNQLGNLVIVTNWGSNDMGSSRTFAQVSTDVANILSQITGLSGVKRLVGLPIIPRTTCSNNILSLTSVSTLATANVTSTAHLRTGQKVTVAGATQANYNGLVTITVIDNQSFSYTFNGAPSPATGTPTAADRWDSIIWQAPANAKFNAGASSDRGQWNAAMRTGKISGLVDMIEISDPVETSRDSSFWASSLNAPSNFHLPLTANGTVSSGISNTAWNSDVHVPYTNYYVNGWVIWLTGVNTGLIRTINSSQTSGVHGVNAAMPATPSAGDTFILFPTGFNFTSDGLHPLNNQQIATSNTSASGQGALYLARDVAITKINQWLAL